jgi:hypothetical protein
MMSVLMLLAGIALGVTLLNPRRRTQPGSDGPKVLPRTTNIEVTVDYPAGAPGDPKQEAPVIAVKPWTAALKEGDDITVEFSTGKASDRMLIVPKDPGDWPFNGNLPAELPPQAGSKVPIGKVKAGSKRTEPYSYDILISVSGLGSGNAPRWIRLDPDLIIFWD